MIIEKSGIRGRYTLELLDADTGDVIQQIELDNLLTDLPRSRYLKQLAGQTTGHNIGDLAIRYMAFGDGTTPAAIGNTKLDNERYRQQITAKTLSADRLTSTVSVSPYQTGANFRIREIGIFCGAGATPAKDSGLLLSRVIVDIDKNSNTILNVIRQDIVELA